MSLLLPDKEIKQTLANIDQLVHNVNETVTQFRLVLTGLNNILNALKQIEK